VSKSKIALSAAFTLLVASVSLNLEPNSNLLIVMKLLLETVKQEMKKSWNEKMYIHIKISYGKDVHEKCPCGRNIEITGRLRSKKSAINRKNAEVLNIREHYSTSPNVVIQNRIRSSNYLCTNSQYTLYAHCCDLKKCIK
jgi:hypothetical protein